MSKKLIFILLAAWIALMPMSVAGAQGQPPPGTQSLNAAYDDHSPVQMTPKQEKELAQKQALVESIQRLEAAGYQPAQIKKTLKLGNQAASSEMLGLEAVPLSGSSDFAYCSMSIWKEPESQPNWCGPGSGEAVISNWRTVPPSGYADATAYMTYLATQMMSGNSTTVSKWISVVNNQIGSAWYLKAYLTGLADYEYKLSIDIYYTSHPVNHLVRTTNLPGWGGYSCNHYVAAWAYYLSGNLIYYGDTAPDSANGSGTPNPYGWHSMSLSSFYNQLGPANGGTPTIMW